MGINNMGMSATQARFLLITARKSNSEYQAQSITYSRLALSNQSASFYETLLTLSVPTPPDVLDFQKVVFQFENENGTCPIKNIIKNTSGSQYSHTVTYTQPASERILMPSTNENSTLMFNSENGSFSVLLNNNKYQLSPVKKVEDEDKTLLNNYTQAKIDFEEARRQVNNLEAKQKNIFESLENLQNQKAPDDIRTWDYDKYKSFLDTLRASGIEDNLNVINNANKVAQRVNNPSENNEDKLTNNDIVNLFEGLKLIDSDNTELYNEKIKKLTPQNMSQPEFNVENASEEELKAFLGNFDSVKLSQFDSLLPMFSFDENKNTFNDNKLFINNASINNLLDISTKLKPDDQNIRNLKTSINDDFIYHNQIIDSTVQLNNYYNLINSCPDDTLKEIYKPGNESCANTYSKLRNLVDGKQSSDFDTDEFIALFNLLNNTLIGQLEKANISLEKKETNFNDLDNQLKQKGYINIANQAVYDKADENQEIYSFINDKGETEYLYLNPETIEKAKLENAFTTDIMGMHYQTSFIEGEYETIIAQANIKMGSNGYMESISFEDGTSYSLQVITEQDDKAYEMAMTKYKYDQAMYDQTMSELQNKIKLVQEQDKTLELKLKRIETEHKALETELESVKSVIQKNVEEGFKLFA